MGDDVRVLVLSGSMGAGKTTVMGTASGLLREAGIRHAALDLDHLGEGHFREASQDELMLRNLATVWRNYADAGATFALLSKPIDTTAKREQIRAAIPAAQVVVCRLTAELETLRERVRARESGLPDQAEMVAHVTRLEGYLDAARVEDFTVNNDDGRAVIDVGREVLVRAGWL